MPVLQHSRRFHAWSAAALIALATIPFGRTLGHALVWDDHYIANQVDRAYQDAGLLGVWNAPFLSDPSVGAVYYRPVVHLSYLLDSRLGAGSGTPYHLANLSLHALVTLLVAYLAYLLLGSRRAAFCGAALFAVLPVHVESVAFVAGRTDLWAACFVLVALTAWLRARRMQEAGMAKAALFVLATAAYGAACLAKEVAFVLPAVVAVWSVLLPGADEGVVGSRWRRMFADTAIFLPGLVVAIALRIAAVGYSAATLGGTDFLIREPGCAARALLWLCRLLVAPWPHNALYTREHLGLTAVTLVASLAVVVTFLAPARVHGVRLGWLAGALSILSLAPSLAVPGSSVIVIAERYLYIPSIGWCVMVGAVVDAAARRWRWGATLPGIALVLGLAVACHLRAAVWRDDASLARDLVRTAPGSALAWDAHGQALLKQMRYEDALASFDRAVTLEPEDPAYHNDAGIALRRLGRPDLAAIAFRRSLELDGSVAGTRLNLAYACISLRDGPCIEQQRRLLSELDPEALRVLDEVLGAAGSMRGR
jgi:tetratricopeptide (TPR) repeat protein